MPLIRPRPRTQRRHVYRVLFHPVTTKTCGTAGSCHSGFPAQDLTG